MYSCKQYFLGGYIFKIRLLNVIIEVLTPISFILVDEHVKSLLCDSMLFTSVLSPSSRCLTLVYLCIYFHRYTCIRHFFVKYQMLKHTGTRSLNAFFFQIPAVSQACLTNEHQEDPQGSSGTVNVSGAVLQTQRPSSFLAVTRWRVPPVLRSWMTASFVTGPFWPRARHGIFQEVVLETAEKPQVEGRSQEVGSLKCEWTGSVMSFWNVHRAHALSAF